MPKQITEIRVFVSCPGDVEAEKSIVKEVCQELSVNLLRSKDTQLRVIDCWNDVVPFITGDDAQTVIDPQLEKYDYDIYIGILWKRFGDKRANGRTPTEGEFYDAFKRYGLTRRPIIQFYFKLDKFYPNNSYEALQSYEVHRFKEKAKQLGFYKEFIGEDDFRTNFRKNLIYIFENFSNLTTKPTPKKKYPAPPNYITRRVCPMKDLNSTDIVFLREEISQDVVSVINEEKRVVLVGDAGVGKSTELKRVAAEFSKDTSPFYPFMVPLNMYVNQRLEELFPSKWRQVPESQLLVILDGLDEMKWIGSENRYDGIRQIELFAKQHPDANILVSCRTNFYQAETNETKGTLDGFKTYVLLNLNQEQVADYVDSRL